MESYTCRYWRICSDRRKNYFDISDYLDDNDFCMAGDAVSDLDIAKSIKFHEEHKKLATITAVYPPGRFGALEVKNNKVTNL